MKSLIIVLFIIGTSFCVAAQRPVERAKMLSSIHGNSRNDNPGRIDNDRKQGRRELRREREPRHERIKGTRHENERRERHEKQKSKREGK